MGPATPNRLTRENYCLSILLKYLVVVVSNILFWFVGCAILSLGVWMKFIEGPVKDRGFYSEL